MMTPLTLAPKIYARTHEFVRASMDARVCAGVYSHTVPSPYESVSR